MLRRLVTLRRLLRFAAIDTLAVVDRLRPSDEDIAKLSGRPLKIGSLWRLKTPLSIPMSRRLLDLFRYQRGARRRTRDRHKRTVAAVRTRLSVLKVSIRRVKRSKRFSPGVRRTRIWSPP
jgi:hypothetical protein